MKKTYIQPNSEGMEMFAEAIIATSIGKNSDRADGNFQELGNKRNLGKNPIWD